MNWPVLASWYRVQYVNFCAFYLPFVFRVHLLAACISISFTSLAAWNSTLWIHHIWLIHSSCEQHLGASILWRWWISLCWIFMFTFLVYIHFHFSWQSLTAELLGHMLTQYLTFSNFAWFPKWPGHSTSQPVVFKCSTFPATLQTLVTICCLVYCLLVMRWNAFVVWFAFPWWLTMLSIFSCTHWLFLCSEKCLHIFDQF